MVMVTEASGTVDMVSMSRSSPALEDARRAREFHSYIHADNLLEPNGWWHRTEVDNLAASLEPYCQLTALRLNVRKAMINCMNYDMIFFLADAMRPATSDRSEHVYEFIEDPILKKCTIQPLHGRICEMVIRQDVTPGQPVPLFVIPDLTKSQFAQLPVVQESPHYRFYAGVPITTKAGVNIGSLAVMDDKVRPRLMPEEENFLHVTAARLMRHLEMNRCALEGDRARNMARGLQQFIAGRSGLDPSGEERLVASRPPLPSQQSSYGISINTDHDANGVDPARTLAPLMVNYQRPRSLTDRGVRHRGNSDTAHGSKLSQESATKSCRGNFSRAANILQECLELGPNGKVIFLGLSSQNTRHSPQSDIESSHIAVAETSPPTHPFQIPPVGSVGHTGSRNAIVIAAASCPSKSRAASHRRDVPEIAMSNDFLRSLTTQYPKGKLWRLRDSFPATDKPSSQSCSRIKQAGQTRSGESGDQNVDMLRLIFPAAQEVMFAPSYDTNRGTFAHGVFVIAPVSTRPFDEKLDLGFLHSFCALVMAENRKIDLMLTDKQKDHFVSTVSHEMRSPLHGVLASVQLLADTKLDSFQKSAISIVEACGKTLLDTINHVLDFSKVNSFQNRGGPAQDVSSGDDSVWERGDTLVPQTRPNGPAFLQIAEVADMASLVEEVLDSLMLGQRYEGSLDIANTLIDPVGRTVESLRAWRGSQKDDAVSVLINIQPADFHFLTSPGAIRRIVLDLVGNALKYTTRGSVTVTMQLEEDRSGEGSDSKVIITVTDTGKGISPAFLDANLFSPFSQEDPLASGVGLGLSIVENIVTTLGGFLDVQSKLDHGTTVTVILPMTRPPSTQQSLDSAPLSTFTASDSMTWQPIKLLRDQPQKFRIGLYGPRICSNKQLMDSLAGSITHFYHQTLVHTAEDASVVIIDESDLGYLTTATACPNKNRPTVVVICEVAPDTTKISYMKAFSDQTETVVEWITKPCGPLKLARSITSVLQKGQATSRHTVHSERTMATQETNGMLTPVTEADGMTSSIQKLDLESIERCYELSAAQAREKIGVCQSSPHGHDAAANSSLGRASIVSGSTGMMSPMISSQQPRILLVDDNKINLSLLDTFLRKRRKYSDLEQALNGRQAVDAVCRAGDDRPFDIIFMDISMPVMNGFEATQAIREFERQNGHPVGAMIVMLTGLASGRDQDEGFASGCDVYMTKPVRFEAVDRLLDDWKSHQRSGTVAQLTAAMRARVEVIMHGVADRVDV